MPSQRNGSGSHLPATVVDPRQRHEVGVAPQDQIGKRAPGEVGGRHPVADVAAGPRLPVARSMPTEQYQSRGAPIGPPQRWVTCASPSAGNISPSRARSESCTPAWRSNSGLIAEPKWYGAPRPPNAMRSSAVRWP